MIRYLSIAALLLGSTAAMAEGPSYSYIQAVYQEIDVDLGGPLDADGDGWMVAGSVEINADWFVFADYGSAGLDGAINVDLDQWSLGGGYNAPISTTTDWYATVSYIDVEASARGFGSASDDGFGIGVGVRSMLNPKLELFGAINYSDLGDGGDDTAFGGGIWYLLSGNLALGAMVEFGDDISSYGVGARLYFDK